METITINNGFLRPVFLSDSAFIQSLFSDVSVKKFFVLRRDHAQDINKFVHYLITQMENDVAINYIITNIQLEPVGLITAELNTHPETQELVWNMSIAISPHYRRQGFATMATKGMTDYLLNTFTIEYVSLDISEENVESINVAEKCGFSKLSNHEARLGYFDLENMEVGVRFKWYKSLADKRSSLFNQAANAFRLKDYISCIRILQLALKEPCNPEGQITDAQIYSNMGMAYSSLKLYPEAYKYLKRAQSLGLNNDSIECELAWINKVKDANNY